jgi:peptidoglycan/xylan/chitin deacetylase (PgdA/CDA1 family)
MRKRAKYVFIAALAPLLVFATVGYVHQRESRIPPGEDTLFLLLPDDVDFKLTAVEQWIDAADEEGFHLRPIHDSDFLNPLFSVHASGIIVPDQLHRAANDVLIGELYRYVRDGGNLMVVYDACTWDLNGRFPPGDSRLSSLVGVRYALYDLYDTSTMMQAQVVGTSTAMGQLAIPPGSFVPMDPAGKLLGWHSVAQHDLDHSSFAFETYQYGAVDYPIFRTLGDFDGEVLLRSKRGIAAGYRRDELGQVLFVNLPLGYLASRTDGLLLHSFLRFFGIHMLGLPYLSSVPDGIGGLIFNWHIDALSSLRPLETLIKEGVFDRGRFSIHFTAGPDVDKFGDHKGLDILHDPEAQRIIQYLLARHQEIGSHGGWIHNYFGYHLNDDNQDQFQKYLDLNKDALEKVSGQHIVEYSAPVGNQPEWVTRWLEHHGFIAYYFTGDAGLGPTRVYRDNHRDADGIWAFPILHMGKEASLEEMSFDDVPIAAVQQWLMAITEFTAREHTARLVYTHPFGAERFFPTLRAWLDNADALANQGRFRWYTMTDLARFLNHRENVRWTLLRDHDARVILRALHPDSLAHDTWVFPGQYYSEARVVHGGASVRVQDGMLFITADDCKRLEVEITVRHGTSQTTTAVEAKR